MKGIVCTPDIEQLLEQAFEKWADHVRQNISVHGVKYFLDSYQKVVSEVLENKPYGYDEYQNDISARDALKIIMDKLDRNQNVEVFEAVDHLDGKLQSTLRPLNENEMYNDDWKAKHPEDQFWWMYGLPRCVEY